MKKHCSHCIRAERTHAEENVALVIGKLNGRPYRGYLCDDHFAMMRNDGLIAASRKTCTLVRSSNLDDLQKQYTRACATVILDANGIAHLNQLRDQLRIAQLNAA